MRKRPVKQETCVVIQRVMRHAVSQHTHTLTSRAVAKDNIQDRYEKYPRLREREMQFSS